MEMELLRRSLFKGKNLCLKVKHEVEFSLAYSLFSLLAPPPLQVATIWPPLYGIYLVMN